MSSKNIQECVGRTFAASKYLFSEKYNIDFLLGVFTFKISSLIQDWTNAFYLLYFKVDLVNLYLIWCSQYSSPFNCCITLSSHSYNNIKPCVSTRLQFSLALFTFTFRLKIYNSFSFCFLTFWYLYVLTICSYQRNEKNQYVNLWIW